MVDVQLADGLPLDYVFARSSLAKEVKSSIEGLLPAGHSINLESNYLGRTTYVIVSQSKQNYTKGRIFIESEVACILDPSLEMIKKKLTEYSPAKCREIIDHYAKKWLNGEPC